MKKTYLLLLTIIMAAGFLIAAGVVTAQTAYADTDGYNLWVGDSQVTSDNRSGAGWSFDPGSNTLTLLISDSGDKNHEEAEAEAIVKIRIRK